MVLGSNNRGSQYKYYLYVRSIININLKIIQLQKKKIIHDNIFINQLMLKWKKSVYKLKSAILNLI